MWAAIGTAVTIIVVGIVFMLIFRKNIGAFIDRTQKVKYGSGEIQAENPSQEPVNTTVSSTEDRMREFDSPVLREQENLINTALTRGGITQEPERERFIVRAFAITKLSLAFEQVHSTIWGSQIYILEYLNERRLIGASKENIKTSFYDIAVTRWPNFFSNPNGVYSYDMYLAFLKASNLIREENDVLFITDFGMEFLRYLTSTGKSNARFKPG